MAIMIALLIMTMRATTPAPTDGLYTFRSFVTRPTSTHSTTKMLPA